MYTRIVLIITSLRSYCLENYRGLLMVNLECNNGKVIGFDEGIKLGLFDGKVFGAILSYTTSVW